MKRILIIIDYLINPRAINYPFLYSDVEAPAPAKHFVICRFWEDGKYWLWCIRWL